MNFVEQRQERGEAALLFHSYLVFPLILSYSPSSLCFCQSGERGGGRVVMSLVLFMSGFGVLCGSSKTAECLLAHPCRGNGLKGAEEFRGALLGQGKGGGACSIYLCLE